MKLFDVIYLFKYNHFIFFRVISIQILKDFLQNLIAKVVMAQFNIM
ncbi:hypothetical protein pb186bvf_001690 [Paramecium bursaria]